MGRKRAWTVVLVIFLTLCCLATLGGGFLAARQFLPLRGLRERDAALPTVHIYNPHHGDEVPLGSNVVVQAEATARAGRVVLLQLWADGQLVGETTGAAAGLSGSWLWMPLTPGDHTLTVRAYNDQRDEGLATVRVAAREIADADLDGTPDDADRCPQQSGLPQMDGCPPDEGWIPAVGEADRDGDGVPDPQDFCPDQPGALAAQGCPSPQAGDSDGDGVPDAEDRCADNPGGADAGGCPQEPVGDRDGDGVLDPDDSCSDQPGSPENQGCPNPQSGDSDGDGVADADDHCPTSAGSAMDGCPATEGEPGTIQGGQERPLPDDNRTAPGLEEMCPACELIDGRTDEEQVFGDVEHSGTAVEIEVTSLRTTVGWSRVFCYLYLNALEWGNQWERVPDIRQAYSLDPSGDPPGPGFWNVARYLGGEHGHLVTVEGPLRVMMQCYGHTGDSLAPATQSLGLLTREHGPADWNGQSLTARAQEGNNWFEISYRICSIPCEEAVIPPPYNLGMTVNESYGIRSYVLHWRWSGAPGSVDGFRIYRDGALVATEYGADHPYTFLSEATAVPGCGREYRFEVRAYKGTQESAPSNPYFSTGEPCGSRNSLMLAEAWGPWPWAANLRLNIRYRYNGDHGRPVVIEALPCQGEGDSCRVADPDLFYHTGAIVGPGEGMAEVHIYYGGTAPATTDGLHLVMIDEDGTAFAFRRVPLSIQWPSSGVDVEIRDVTISADQLEVFVRNSGYAPLQTWFPTLLLETAEGHRLTPPSVPVVPSLPPGGLLIIRWPLSEAGWDLLRAGYEITVDPDNQLAELNEANNTFAGTVDRLRITYEQVAFFNHGREMVFGWTNGEPQGGFVGPGGQLLALIPGPSGPWRYGEMLEFKGAVRDDWVDNWAHNDLYWPHEEGWAAPISADPAAPLWRDLAGVFRIIRGSCYEEGYIDSTHYGAGGREEMCGHLIARGFAPEQNWVEVRHTPGSPQRFWIYLYDVDVHYQWWPPDYVEEYETICEFYTELTAGQLQSLPGEFTLGSAEQGCMVQVRVEEVGP